MCTVCSICSVFSCMFNDARRNCQFFPSDPTNFIKTVQYHVSWKVERFSTCHAYRQSELCQLHSLTWSVLRCPWHFLRPPLWGCSSTAPLCAADPPHREHWCLPASATVCPCCWAPLGAPVWTRTTVCPQEMRPTPQPLSRHLARRPPPLYHSSCRALVSNNGNLVSVSVTLSDTIATNSSFTFLVY